MPGIGHNQGPSLESGTGWRRHCWTVARAALLPALPIEVVRLRVKRAAEIGLEYRTYASIRAASGHDVVAFLFSTNALHLLPGRSGLPAAVPAGLPSVLPAGLPAERAARLAGLRAAGRAALAQAPLDARDLAPLMPAFLDHAAPAPAPHAPWAEARARILAALEGPHWPGSGVVMVGETGIERDWAAAARLGCFLPAERFFAA